MSYEYLADRLEELSSSIQEAQTRLDAQYSPPSQTPGKERPASAFVADVISDPETLLEITQGLMSVYGDAREAEGLVNMLAAMRPDLDLAERLSATQKAQKDVTKMLYMITQSYIELIEVVRGAQG